MMLTGDTYFPEHQINYRGHFLQGMTTKKLQTTEKRCRKMYLSTEVTLLQTVL